MHEDDDEHQVDDDSRQRTPGRPAAGAGRPAAREPAPDPPGLTSPTVPPAPDRDATTAPPTPAVPGFSLRNDATRQGPRGPGVPRTAPSRTVAPIGHVTAATLPLHPTEDAGPARRSRAERQEIVLDTAERLFSARSSRSVGMDELVRETGLGKMTVYRLFKSKDDLVGAYLARKAATVLGFIDADLHRLQGDPRAALLSVVDAVEADVTRAGFRGCPFTNVSSEYDDPQHPARSAAADYKYELHMRLLALAGELVPGHGEDLAAQVHLIIDGMYLSGGLLGPDGPASHGRQLAEKLIDAAIAGA